MNRAQQSGFVAIETRDLIDGSRRVIADALTAREKTANILTRDWLERAEQRNVQWHVTLRRMRNRDRV